MRHDSRMSIPTEVQANVEDNVQFSGDREVWPTTAEPTSPLWRYAFHHVAAEKFGSNWKGSGHVHCTSADVTDVAATFPDLVTAAAAIHADALRDPEIVAIYSDEPDGKFPTQDDRYSIPA